MPRRNKKNNGQVGQYLGGNAPRRWFKQPFPDEMCVTLKYAVELDTTATVGSYSYKMALNDVYDPDITSTGSQPLGFDQWTALYTRFCVVESAIDVAVTSRAASARLSVAVVPLPQSTNVPGTYEAAMCCRFAKGTTTTGGGPTYHIKNKKKVCEIMGVPPYAIESDDSFSGTNGASPNRLGTWFMICETSGSSDALSLSVTVSYKVRFWLPNQIALSATRRSAKTQTVVERPRDRVTLGDFFERQEPSSPVLSEAPRSLRDSEGENVAFPACAGTLGRHPFLRPCVWMGDTLFLTCSCGRGHARRDIPDALLPAAFTSDPEKSVP